MGLSKIFREIVWSSLLCGLVLGHLDLLYRVFSQNFEWFELYQSLLLACLIAPPLLFISLPIAWLIGIVKDRDNIGRYISDFYRNAIVIIPLFVLLQLFIKSFFVHGDSLYSSPRLEITLFISATYVLLVNVSLHHFRDRVRDIQLWWKDSRWKAIASHYAWFLAFFLGSCFITDLYMLHTSSPAPGIPSRLQDKPNIVLISLDTVRADHLGMYGYEKPTSPFLDALATQSLVFQNAYSTSSWTLPAHASLFTGKYVHNHGAHMSHQKLVANETTLAEKLRSIGYHTAGFVAGPYCKEKYGIGQGFNSYNDRLDFFETRHTKDHLSIRRALDFLFPSLHDYIFQADGERTASELHADIFPWLERNKDSRFFLFINYFDAHDPYDQGTEFRRLFTSEKLDYSTVHFFLDRHLRFRSEYEVKPKINWNLLEYTEALYDSEIRHLDSHIKDLIEHFQRLGIYENTLFVFVSDHGEEFLDHGSVFHEHTLYNELIRIPLMVHWASQLRAASVDQLVSIVDIFPTVLELVEVPPDYRIDGHSFVSLMRGMDERLREYHLAERFRRDEYGESGLIARVERDWKYIRSAPEQRTIPHSLFDLAQDPHEKNNLLASRPQQYQRMSRALDESFQGKTPDALRPNKLDTRE